MTRVADRQVDLSVRSTALGSRTVKVRLPTPDGWNPDGRRQKWPTFWLLHCCCGDYTSWTRMTEVAETDSLRDVLVVSRLPLMRRRHDRPLDQPGATSALEADFNRQNHALADELKRVGARHVTTHFYGPGTHTWAYWKRELHASMPRLLDALGLDN